MLAKRIIACLDVRDGRVVKGVKFKDHEDVGGVLDLARRYSQQGADELVFYDIAASARGGRVSRDWVRELAGLINIPFCVAGGIGSEADAAELLANGADKISINSPALREPALIDRLAARFGSQCVVLGVDSFTDAAGNLRVWALTGDERTSHDAGRDTLAWIREATERGAGEVVLNMMNADGTRSGYDLAQLRAARAICGVPLVASGGAGRAEHFAQAFAAGADACLAASIFHKNIISIPELKTLLKNQGLAVRL